MRANNPIDYPRARTMVHPGPYNPVRLQSRLSDKSSHLRMVLQQGKNLLEALVEPLAARGIYSASTTILGGSFNHLEYCTASAGSPGEHVAFYSDPLIAGPSHFMFGNATVGRNEAGQPVVHCHAVFRDQHGHTKGGHILPHIGVIEVPPVVIVTPLRGFELRIAFDSETNISVLQPLDIAAPGDRS